LVQREIADFILDLSVTNTAGNETDWDDVRSVLKSALDLFWDKYRWYPGQELSRVIDHEEAEERSILRRVLKKW
jgi:hypothetical protein